jgi:hypothetical protein
MPTKKGTPGRSRENQVKARQAQWQRRVAAQGGAVVSATPAGVTEDGIESSPVGMGTDARVATPRSTATATPRSRVKSPMESAAQRRSTSIGARGSARLRMTANQMSIDDEMDYVRSDIRRLVILTALCLVVLIALAFVIR